MEGKKFDTGKAGWHLLPYDAVDEVIKVLDFGAQKYEPRNWERGMAWSRLFAATVRHLTGWWMAKITDHDGRDPESELSHLAHAACDVLFLLAYELRGTDNDDRPDEIAK